MRNTKTPRMIVKKKGRDGWMVFNPTMGTYQNKKIREKRIKQVKTKSPIKILFLGLVSKSPSDRLRNAECRMRNEKI
jgi:PIN domain nuclease of toxin-antitoxin system